MYKSVLLEQIPWNVFNLVLSILFGSTGRQLGQIYFVNLEMEKLPWLNELKCP